MEPVEASSVTVEPGRVSSRSDLANACTVVALRGEHDVSMSAQVVAALREAVSLDDNDIVVDLSGVRFLGAAILGAFADTQRVLHAQSRALRLRRPSPCALRLVELCGLEALLECRPLPARPTGPGGALATWVAVPRSGVLDQPGDGTGSDSTSPSHASHLGECTARRRTADCVER